MSNLPVFVAAAVAAVVTALIGFKLIPFLKKIHFGQTILDIGPRWHKDKQGTPIMGGFMFIIGILAAVGAAYLTAALAVPEAVQNKAYNMKLFAGIIMALGFSFIGFLDDYIKAVKKRNLGLNEKQKLILQFVVAGVYMVLLYCAGDSSTIVAFPFLGQINLSFFYYPLAMVGIVFLVNAVNLTDGIDGLSSSVTFVVALGFLVISGMLQVAPMGILSAALAGGCLGFLFWNIHPAKVFMGDTGSMFLGGMVVALGFGVNFPLILIFAGILYIIEALSVVIQVTSFKLTGKRIFKMSPIHHHFEMSGYGENKIVILFSAVALIGVLLSIAAVAVL